MNKIYIAVRLSLFGRDFDSSVDVALEEVLKYLLKQNKVFLRRYFKTSLSMSLFVSKASFVLRVVKWNYKTEYF